MSITRITDAKVFEGMSLPAAQEQIHKYGYEMRVVWMDGLTLHADYKPEYDPLRVNLHVKENKVIKATIG